MAELLQLRPSEHVNPDIVSLLEEQLELARRGEIIGVAIIAQLKSKEYTYSRVELSYELAIALHNRAQYKLHQDWDRGR
jgi:hypothetical protein